MFSVQMRIKKIKILFVGFIIINFGRMTSFHSSVRPITKVGGVSLHQLNQWNKQLDFERIDASYVKQDMKKQKKIGKHNNQAHLQSISKIEQQAALLSVKLQEELTKNHHLTVLVNNVQSELYKEKLQKYQDVMDKKEPDQYQEKKQILKKNQKLLSDTLIKLNSSSCEIEQKIQLIRSLRSERGVFSGLFDKLERQHFDVEFYYKQLLIERTLLEKNFGKYVDRFNQIHIKSQNKSNPFNSSFYEKEVLPTDTITSFEGDGSSINIFNTQSMSIRDARSFRISNDSEMKIVNTPQKIKSKKENLTFKQNLVMQQKQIQQLKQLQFNKKINNIKNDLGCATFLDIIAAITTGKKFQQSQTQPQQFIESQPLFGDSNQLYEQIFKYQKQVQDMERRIAHLRVDETQSFSSKTMNLKKQVTQFDAQANKTKKQVISFKNQFNKIFHRINQNNSNFPGKIKTKINKPVKQNAAEQQQQTFIQNYQQLKDLMTFFNDEIFEENLAKKIPKIRKKSLMLNLNKTKKPEKTDKKRAMLYSKKERAQTQCSQQQYRYEKLESILSHNRNDRGDKNMMSILTQQEFIEESKKILKISKKKSGYHKN